jgi:hypothetical protein
VDPADPLFDPLGRLDEVRIGVLLVQELDQALGLVVNRVDGALETFGFLVGEVILGEGRRDLRLEGAGGLPQMVDERAMVLRHDLSLCFSDRAVEGRGLSSFSCRAASQREASRRSYSLA